MAEHNITGLEGEKLAINYLIKEKYTILETNWRYKKSEIDIIAQKNKILTFVEVKTRTSTYFQKPEESVTLKKQKLIILASNEYAKDLNEDIELRFDIITVIIQKEKIIINHIKEAFYPLIKSI